LGSGRYQGLRLAARGLDGLICGMGRPPRIEYPGPLYHVISRGNERRAIVRDDADRRKRLDWLRRAVETYGWRLHAFVLMNNHDHLFMETPQANLSAGRSAASNEPPPNFSRPSNAWRTSCLIPSTGLTPDAQESRQENRAIAHSHDCDPRNAQGPMLKIIRRSSAPCHLRNWQTNGRRRLPGRC